MVIGQRQNSVESKKLGRLRGTIYHSSQVLHLPKIIIGRVAVGPYHGQDLFPKAFHDVRVHGQTVHRKSERGCCLIECGGLALYI